MCCMPLVNHICGAIPSSVTPVAWALPLLAVAAGVPAGLLIARRTEKAAWWMPLALAALAAQFALTRAYSRGGTLLAAVLASAPHARTANLHPFAPHKIQG